MTFLVDLCVSLDGYVAGPDVGPDNPMGTGGEALFDWLFTGRSADEAREYEDSYYASVGALVIGRKMADLGIGPWGDNPSFHAPCFVVTHRPRDVIAKEGGTSYTFITDGPHAAVQRAREAAGDLDVQINGGADLAGQCLEAGLVDELRLRVVPVVLGAGTRFLTGLRPGLRLTPTSASVDADTARLLFNCTTVP
jgi:dihydrofolate reductase